MMLEAPQTRSAPGAKSCPLRGCTVKCGGCAKSFELREWLALPLVKVLTGEAIAAHVVRWPHGLCIQIRRCGKCGRPIARSTYG
jgi:hypothetical protein